MVIELQPEEFLRMPGVAGSRLVCLAGALWITHDNDARDTVLEPGMDYVVGKGAIIQAVRFARLLVA